MTLLGYPDNVITMLLCLHYFTVHHKENMVQYVANFHASPRQGFELSIMLSCYHDNMLSYNTMTTWPDLHDLLTVLQIRIRSDPDLSSRIRICFMAIHPSK
jgi:hypothetical protein